MRHTAFLWLMLAFIIAPCFSVMAQIQVQPNYHTLPLGNDTLCFRYHFEPQDTLIYSVDAADSIVFAGDPILLRIRTEHIRVVCDSVTPDHVYHLGISMVSYHERTVNGRDSTERTSHAWVGKMVRLGIDSLGHRKYAYNENPSQGVVAPGGAFQPLLFPPLDTSCGRQNQSWMYEDTIALVENAVPYPVMHIGLLWRVIDKADTLGKTYMQIQYTQSGIGRLVVEDEHTTFDLQCQNAGYGKLSFDPVLDLLYASFATAENKLTLILPNGKERKGVHKIMMRTMLEHVYRSSKP